MVPGHPNHTSFLAPEVGTFEGECAEFCGTQHAHMRFLVIVEPPDKFSRWIEHQQQPVHSPWGSSVPAIRKERGARQRTRLLRVMNRKEGHGTTGDRPTHRSLSLIHI